MTISVLAEAESLASYGRKRLALSYERPISQSKPKSHSPNVQSMTWDIPNAMRELENFPPNEKINWTAMASQHNVPSKNAGQVLKETAKKHGIDTSRLEHKMDSTPRSRRHKCRLPGGEISITCLPTVSTIKEEQKQLIISGKLNIGEPFHCTKSVITDKGNVVFKSVQICGRKISLHDIRVALLKKQECYMHMLTHDQIESMSREDIIATMNMAHHKPISEASVVELKETLSHLQCTRTLAMWHDHSTILQTGYILFAVWVVYDPAVFYTQDEWARRQTRYTNRNIQSLVEEPMIYMIAPSSSSPIHQLALVGDRVECLQELSNPVSASNGIEIRECLRFFCGDKPAQQFERGTQIGGTYKCGGCCCKDSMMMDLAHAFHHSWRSLADIQAVILAANLGNKPGSLKPLDNLKVIDLRKELQARGVQTEGLLKPQLISTLTDILQGAQRVPTLLTL